MRDDVNSAMDDAATARLQDALPRLTPEQKDLLSHLAEDMANGEVAPMHVATAESARVVLARFESDASQLSVRECHEYLHGLECRVAMDPVAEDDPCGDAFMVSHTWTLKGLRSVVARERFMGSITCDQDRDTWEKQS